MSKTNHQTNKNSKYDDLVTDPTGIVRLNEELTWKEYSGVALTTDTTSPVISIQC